MYQVLCFTAAHMQTTLWVIPGAFVDDDLYKGLMFLALLMSREMEAKMIQLFMVVAMGCFAASSPFLQWSGYCLILTPS
jgi:hypothetical protein